VQFQVEAANHTNRSLGASDLTKHYKLNISTFLALLNRFLFHQYLEEMSHVS
jgi:hypothetical protein